MAHPSSTSEVEADDTHFITLGCVFVSIGLGLGLAMLLDRKSFGRGFIRTLLITPFLIMPVAGAMLWSISMFDPTYGLINWLIGTVGISPVDWTSQLPMLSIIIALVWQWTPSMMLLLGAIYVVNTFDQIHLMTAGGPGTASANLPFYIYQRAFLGFDIGQSAAMGAVTVIATFALRLIFTSINPKEQS